MCRDGIEDLPLKQRVVKGECTLNGIIGIGKCSAMMQAGVDVAIGVQMTVYSFDPDVEAVVLVAGDGDFQNGNALDRVAQSGKSVFVAGFSSSLAASLQQYSKPLYLDRAFPSAASATRSSSRGRRNESD